MAAAAEPTFNLSICWHPKCSSTKTQTCSRCKTARYCGKEHQKDDWNAVHKIACKAFRQLPKHPETPTNASNPFEAFMQSMSQQAAQSCFIQACHELSKGKIIEALSLLQPMHQLQRESVIKQVNQLLESGEMRLIGDEWSYIGPPTPLIPGSEHPSHQVSLSDMLKRYEQVYPVP